MKNHIRFMVVASKTPGFAKQVVLSGSLAGVSFDILKDYIAMFRERLSIGEYAETEFSYDADEDAVPSLRFHVVMASGLKLTTNALPPRRSES